MSGCIAWALALAGPALAAEPPPQYVRSFGPDGSEATGFERAGPIAVDQKTHVVYVLDHKGGSGEGSLLKFDAEGDPLPFSGSAPYISGNRITGLSLFSGSGETQIAVDSISHDVYVTSGNAITAFQADGEEALFTAGPGAGTNTINGFSELLGLAVDSHGDIYATDFPTAQAYIYTHSGELIDQFETMTGPGNLAVDSHGTVYVNKWRGEVRKFIPSSYPVTSATTYSAVPLPVDPNTSWTVAVDPVSDEVYIAEADEGLAPEPRIARYSESGNLTATFAGPGEEGEILKSEGIGLDGGKEEIFVSNLPEAGPSQVEIFGPYEGVPVVGSSSAANVSAYAATLRARINPGGSNTTYRFEYGLHDCALGGCASVPAGAASIGEGHRGVSVSQSLTELIPSTTYHYRVVAENEFGNNLATERDRTFTTQGAALDFRLPDRRAWEMVSPPDKHGGLVKISFTALVQAAADGEGIIYPTVGSVEEHPEGNRAWERSTVLSRRGPQGWSSTDLTTPNDEAEGTFGGTAEYKLFSSDLLRSILEPATATPLSSGAYFKTPYLRVGSQPPVYEPIVTESSVPPGAENGTFAIVGANQDLSGVAITSSIPLTPGAPSNALYLWSNGYLQPLSVLPVAQGGGIVAAGVVGSGAGSLRHAITEDGSRVFWSTGSWASRGGNETTGLYLRKVVDGETVRLDVAESGATGAGTERPAFEGANPNGTVVFFTDSQQLTEDAGASGRDLYRCELPSGSGGSGCANLTDITSQTQAPGESAEVQGVAAGIADDGNTIYFVARSILDPAANQANESAVSGAPNLYIWQQGHGVRFIARLSADDQNDWGGSQETVGKLSAASSPSGRFLSFMSNRSLTGAENGDAASGEAVQEVYRYDAVADRLDCVSCNPTGAAPHGELIPKEAVALGDRRSQVDPNALWRGSWVAATVPERPIKDLADGLSFYSPRAVLDNGRVFFNSIDSLVPADANGQWDVYQYEPTDLGDCSGASGNAATARIAQGCVSLVSSGKAEEETGFLDASESGNDVFFVTSAQLNEPDQDHEPDVYDARVNGTPVTLPAHPECLGEACQPISKVSEDAIPSSAMFEGTGNLRARHRKCKAGKRRARHHGKVICIRRHGAHNKSNGHARGVRR